MVIHATLGTKLKIVNGKKKLEWITDGDKLGLCRVETVQHSIIYVCVMHHILVDSQNHHESFEYFHSTRNPWSRDLL
jgi:hypothetical protein